MVPQLYSQELTGSSRLISIGLILLGSTYYTYAKSYLEKPVPAIHVTDVRESEKSKA